MQLFGSEKKRVNVLWTGVSLSLSLAVLFIYLLLPSPSARRSPTVCRVATICSRLATQTSRRTQMGREAHTQALTGRARAKTCLITIHHRILFFNCFIHSHLFLSPGQPARLRRRVGQESPPGAPGHLVSIPPRRSFPLSSITGRDFNQISSDGRGGGS